MSDTVLFSEGNEVLAKIDPASYNSAQSTAWIKLDKHSRAIAIIQIGLIAATGTFNAKLEQATDGSGTGAKDITGKAITAMADTADNKVRMIELRSDELDVAANFFWFRLTLTPATAASLASAVVIGCNPFYRPVTIHADLAVTN